MRGQYLLVPAPPLRVSPPSIQLVWVLCLIMTFDGHSVTSVAIFHFPGLSVVTHQLTAQKQGRRRRKTTPTVGTVGLCLFHLTHYTHLDLDMPAGRGVVLLHSHHQPIQ